MGIAPVLIGLAAVTAIFVGIKIARHFRNKNEMSKFSAEKEILKLQQEAQRKKKALSFEQAGLSNNSTNIDVKSKQMAQLALLMQRLLDKKKG